MIKNIIKIIFALLFPLFIFGQNDVATEEALTQLDKNYIEISKKLQEQNANTNDPKIIKAKIDFIQKRNSYNELTFFENDQNVKDYFKFQSQFLDLFLFSIRSTFNVKVYSKLKIDDKQYVSINQIELNNKISVFQNIYNMKRKITELRNTLSLYGKQNNKNILHKNKNNILQLANALNVLKKQYDVLETQINQVNAGEKLITINKITNSFIKNIEYLDTYILVTIK